MMTSPEHDNADDPPDRLHVLDIEDDLYQMKHAVDLLRSLATAPYIEPPSLTLLTDSLEKGLKSLDQHWRRLRALERPAIPAPPGSSPVIADRLPAEFEALLRAWQTLVECATASVRPTLPSSGFPRRRAPR